MKVFLYGTLRRGASNAHRMDGARFVAEGSVAGRLIKVDWYPGLVLDAEAGPARGEVWEVSPELLAELDRYEGCDPESGIGADYRRVMASVRLDDGGTSDAWVWDWTGPADGFPVIESGDWLGQR
jgi:gamma-glutamylcyclotransferase (GGCT)/AIG2-like uncharacterized protein YtfP